jgi:hypothetical protein
MSVCRILDVKNLGLVCAACWDLRMEVTRAFGYHWLKVNQRGQPTDSLKASIRSYAPAALLGLVHIQRLINLLPAHYEYRGVRKTTSSLNSQRSFKSARSNSICSDNTPFYRRLSIQFRPTRIWVCSNLQSETGLAGDMDISSRPHCSSMSHSH